MVRSVSAEQEDADGFQVAARYGDLLPVRAPSRHAAPPPVLRCEAFFITAGQCSDVGLVVQDMLVTFDLVEVPGQTALTCATFEDPRVADVDLDLMPLFGIPHVIPSHVRAFERNSDNKETFRLCFASSTHDFSGLARTKAIEEGWLGFEPDCDDPDLSMRPRFYYSEDEEPPIIEPEHRL